MLSVKNNYIYYESCNLKIVIISRIKETFKKSIPIHLCIQFINLYNPYNPTSQSMHIKHIQHIVTEKWEAQK